LAGCDKGGKKEVTTYDVPKEESKAEMPMATMAQQPPIHGLAEVTQGFSIPKWDVPEGWVAQSLGTMRKGSFLVTEGDKSAEVSVLAFPGDVGGVLQNVNRWRDQINLEGISEAVLSKFPTENVDGFKSIIVDAVNSETGKAVLGAIVPQSAASWYFKMMGDASVVESQRDNFVSQFTKPLLNVVDGILSL